MGSFPIAQVREPFSTVQYIAERMDLPKLLKLQHPEGDDEWSAMDVCDGIDLTSEMPFTSIYLYSFFFLAKMYFVSAYIF